MILNANLDRARKRVDSLEPELARVYERPLRVAARLAANRFKTLARPGAVTAATAPWEPPDPDALVDGDRLAAETQRKAQPIHERALRLVGDATVGIAFPIDNPFAQQLLDAASARASQIVGGFSDELSGAIRDAHNQGLSVPKAAALIRERGVAASKVTSVMLARTTLNGISNGGSLLAAQLVADASAEAGEAGPATKTWVTAGDERVRDTHADADGQTVPIDQPFDVGGEQLMYPGDPAGSDEEIINCRCTLVYGEESVSAAGVAPMDALHSPVTVDESRDVTTEQEAPAVDDGTLDAPLRVDLSDFHLTAAAGEPTRWTATLVVEGRRFEDGRMIGEGAATWRGLPLPLGLMTDTMHADDSSAPVVGRIDQIWRAGNLIQAAGVFDTSPDAQDAIRLIEGRFIDGISCDGVCDDWEVIATQREETDDATDEVEEAIDSGPAVEVYDDDMEYTYVARAYTIMGATICPGQADAQARIQVVTAAGEERWQFVAPFAATRCEVAPAQPLEDPTGTLREAALRALDGLVAAASADKPDAPKPLTVAEMQELLAPLARPDSVEALVAALVEGAVGKINGEAERLLAGVTTTLERTVADAVKELDAKQTASLTAAAAGAEAYEELAERLGTLQNTMVRAVELLERKPRQIEFERDKGGKLVGMRES